MTAAEAAQALLALCSAIVAIGIAVAFLIPSEPIAPGQFGDHRAAIALTRNPAPLTTRVLLPIWREPLDLDAAPIHVPDGAAVTFTGPQPDAVITTRAALSDSDVDRLWRMLTDPERHDQP